MEWKWSYLTYSVYNSFIISRQVVNISGQDDQLALWPSDLDFGCVLVKMRDQDGIYTLWGPCCVFMRLHWTFVNAPKVTCLLALNDWSRAFVRKSLQCANKEGYAEEGRWLKMSKSHILCKFKSILENKCCKMLIGSHEKFAHEQHVHHQWVVCTERCSREFTSVGVRRWCCWNRLHQHAASELQNLSGKNND